MSGVIVDERARRWIVALSILSLVATIVGLVYGRKLSPREHSPYDSYGRGPLGTRIMVETLTRSGISVSRQSDISKLELEYRPVLFLAPEGSSVEIDGEQFRLGEIIKDRIESESTTIVVLPKWKLSEFGYASLISTAEIVALLEGLGFDAEVLRVPAETKETRIPLVSDFLHGIELELGRAQTVRLSTTTEESMLQSSYATHGEGSLIFSDASGYLVVITDADLVSNFAVSRADHAEVLVQLLEQFEIDHAVIDETFHGRTETRSLAEMLGEWPGFLLLVQGALVVLAILLAGRHRFGPAREAPAAYGRGPKEAVTVAADVLSLGRAPQRLAQRYVELLVCDIHRRLRLVEDGHRIAPEVAAASLDRLARERHQEPSAEALLTDARALGSAKIGKRDGLRRTLLVATRAHALRLNMLDPKRIAGEKT